VDIAAGLVCTQPSPGALRAPPLAPAILAPLLHTELHEARGGSGSGSGGGRGAGSRGYLGPPPRAAVHPRGRAPRAAAGRRRGLPHCSPCAHCEATAVLSAPSGSPTARPRRCSGLRCLQAARGIAVYPLRPLRRPLRLQWRLCGPRGLLRSALVHLTLRLWGPLCSWPWRRRRDCARRPSRHRRQQRPPRLRGPQRSCCCCVACPSAPLSQRTLSRPFSRACTPRPPRCRLRCRRNAGRYSTRPDGLSSSSSSRAAAAAGMRRPCAAAGREQAVAFHVGGAPPSSPPLPSSSPQMLWPVSWLWWCLPRPTSCARARCSPPPPRGPASMMGGRRRAEAEEGAPEAKEGSEGLEGGG